MGKLIEVTVDFEQGIVTIIEQDPQALADRFFPLIETSWNDQEIQLLKAACSSSMLDD